ncbi:hypothetical protein GCM10010990_36480 [Croceicoccus mobilis]|uniref:Uncharacterized protein n=1 Tax=Croceicoccus mobilis TaxID=1703339 RepID=A0A916ZAK7_9SPHN|nr:hypothetical protein GCM10010990_36480 [Croceicoccus mobilis]
MTSQLDDLAKAFSEPSAEEIAFHEDRRRRGLGVGLNEQGELVYQRDINAKSNSKSESSGKSRD